MAVKEGGADNRTAIRTTQNYWHWALQTLSREDSENYIRWNARKGCWQCLDLDDEVDRGITTRKVMSTTWEKDVEGSSKLESLNASLGDRLEQLLGKEEDFIAAQELCSPNEDAADSSSRASQSMPRTGRAAIRLR